MAEITASQVKQLRESTGAGMMDCKKALVETGGDLEKAAVYLREKGIAGAAKKADRAANEGQVAAYVTEDETTGALIEVNCETDFVARNEQFRALVGDLARQLALSGRTDLASFLAGPTTEDPNKTIDAVIKEAIGTIGENIVVSRVAILPASDGLVGSYVHWDGKKGALVAVSGQATEASRDAARQVAMQAVALRAPFLNRDSVPAEVIESEKAIYRAQAAEEGKPAEMQDKIAEGRLGKFYKENTLLEQTFIKDDKKSVQQLVKEAGATLSNFVRFEVGERAA